MADTSIVYGADGSVTITAPPAKADPPKKEK